MADLDLLIEHQANFAMIPLTLEKVLDHGCQPELKKDVIEYVSNKMDHQHTDAWQLFGGVYAATAL